MGAAKEILEHLLTCLEDATKGRTGFTLGFLGTVGLDGGPRVRAVILRAVDREAGRIMIATNSSSGKVSEMDRVPQVALTMYDDHRGVQLRVTGTARIIEDSDERARAWRHFAPHSRHLYASPLIPGSPLMDVEDLAGETSDEAAAFDRFAWVGLEMDHLDWLDFSGSGQVRWEFDLVNGAWHGQEVVP
ncbi:pyridoxamine 5'-phosphate oxidase family protein [Paenarthrobacter sp. NPDC090522]|uniref:pyridoxamine 5'-phosphate oxidase family protein n=1 Tax=Paenarthrobacter sp. NPDC090522 TaxID=3364383 RepID=UPI0038182FDE